LTSIHIAEHIIRIAKEAGSIILDIYDTDFDVEYKGDESPLTIADQKANDHIVKELLKLFPNANMITEETRNEEFDVRKNWEQVWIVDPLDGTKEFVKKNGEFTVNIALLENGEATLGVIYVPVKDEIYYAIKGQGSFKIANGESTHLKVRDNKSDKLIVVGSRSHRSPKVDEYVGTLMTQYTDIEYLAAGSSLKFCLVAEGKADIYPRFGPTMEWDIAAGSIIAEEAGASITKVDDGERLTFNKEDLLNPFFIVSAI